ncbi:right-handed parallel beta-helix repeat-containing protein [Candidatus Woesearchaeota archaeon]|nr:right-handed parallel beta-helix repeat-containing protein [Candidatus Woesearchaeota archaeon]
MRYLLILLFLIPSTFAIEISSGQTLICDEDIVCKADDEAGIIVADATNVIIQGCTLIDCFQGILISDSTDVTVKDTTFIRSGFGIFSLNSTNIRADNLILQETIPNGTSIYYDGESVTYSNLTLGTALAPRGKLRDFSNSSEGTPITEDPVEEEMPASQTEYVSITLTPDSIDRILRNVLSSSYPDLTTDQKQLVLRTIQQQSQDIIDQVTITRTFLTLDNTTKVTVKVNTTKGGLDYYEDIPKCAAEHASQILFYDSTHKIVIEDPLIVWEIEAQRSVNYDIPGVVDDHCARLFKSVLLDQNIESLNLYNQSVKEEYFEEEHQKRTGNISIFIIILGVAIFGFLLYVYNRRR